MERQYDYRLVKQSNFVGNNKREGNSFTCVLRSLGARITNYKTLLIPKHQKETKLYKGDDRHFK